MCTCNSNCDCSTVCGCSSTLSSVCVTYKGVDLDSLGAVTDDNLERILIGLDAIILNLTSLVASNPIGINVGGGTELFKPATADFRTFGDTSSIDWVLNGDLVEASISAAWITANITPIIADVATNTAGVATNLADIATNVTSIGTNVTNITANVADIADIRTLTGTVDGETAYPLANFTGTTIIEPSTIESALQDLETAVETAGLGEVNDGANVGISGLGIYDGTKAGVNINFRKLDPIGSYVTAVLNGQKIDLDLNTTNLKTLLDTYYVEQADTTTVTDVSTGSNLITARVGDNYDLKGLVAGDGILFVTTGTDIEIKVDETWLATQIDNGMAGIGNAKTYLFSATKINEQIVLAGISGMRIPFEDDSSAGYYDYENNWTISQFKVNSDLVTDTETNFVMSMDIEFLTANTTNTSITFCV